MKPTDFYDGTVQSNGTELTGSIVNIVDPEVDYMDAYYMGYVSFYSLPENLKFHQIHLEGGSLLITDQTDRNHAWGFCNVEQYYGLSYSDVVYTYNGVIHTKKIAPNPKFINDIKMSQHAVANGLRLNLRYIFIPANDLDTNDTAYSPPKSDGSYTMHVIHLDLPVISATIGGIEYTGYDAFFNDSEPINFGTATLNGDSVSLEFLASDFSNTDNPTCRREITAGGSAYVLFAQLTSFQFNDYGAYISDSNNIASFGVVPFLEFDALFEDDGVKTMAVGTCSEFARLIINLDFNSGNFITTASIDAESITGGYYQGNFYIINNDMSRGESGSEYWYAAVTPGQYPGFGRNGIMRGRHITDYANAFTNTFYIYTFLKPSDIWNSIIPYHKLDTLHDTNNATVPNKTYTPDYSTSIYESNVPTEERKQDTLSNITEYLMNWQRPDNAISIDEFDIADMPIEPVPPPTPPADDERSFGIDYEPNTAYSIGTLGGFITQYAMTQDQIAQFGHYLWAAFNDSDFWDSISVILPESLSLNPSDILKYIISVRMFPFSLSGMPSFSPGTDSKIYIGRGFKPIDINTQMTVGTIDSYTEDIDGGYADIPAFHNDFRDYEPCARAIVTIPFCGSLELVPSQIIGARVHLRYGIDYSSGAVQATVTVENGTKYIAGILNGSIGATVQMTASNLSQVLQGGIKAGAEIVKGVALIAAGAASSSAGAGMTDAEAIASSEMMAQAPSVGVNSINSILSLDSVPPQKISMSNGFASMQVTEANVRLEFRHYTKPANYAHVHGYACDKTVTLGSLEGKGFTVCKNVDLTGVPATQDELAALEALLQSGVYL